MEQTNQAKPLEARVVLNALAALRTVMEDYGVSVPRQMWKQAMEAYFDLDAAVRSTKLMVEVSQ